MPGSETRVALAPAACSAFIRLSGEISAECVRYRAVLHVTSQLAAKRKMARLAPFLTPFLQLVISLLSH